MFKTLTAIAALVALTSWSAPVAAGSNECIGYVTAGKITDDGWSLPPAGECTFSSVSKIGKMILAKCPIGTTCRVSLPLEAKSNPITTTRVEISKECDGHCAPYSEEEVRPYRQCEARGLRWLSYYGECRP
jgi:hypothetical protein